MESNDYCRASNLILGGFDNLENNISNRII